MPVPYDPTSDYVCPCVYLYLYQYSYPCPVSSKALGIEGPEYVCEVSGCGTDTDTNTGRILTLVVALFSLLAVHDCQ